MVSRYEGRGCALIIYSDSILIEHKPKSAQDVPVLLSRLSDVHYEPATRWVSGIVTIAVDGNALAVPTGTSVGSDPNTVVFKYKANDTFFGIQEWLRRVVANNQGIGPAPTGSPGKRMT